jgi:hypothetical protein
MVRAVRGRFFAVPPADRPPPGFRLRGRLSARPRRGAMFAVVPPPVVQAPPRPPDWVTRRRPWIGRRVRSGFPTVTPANASPLPYQSRARVRAVRPRHGSFFTPVPAPVVVAPPRPPDRITRDRPAAVRARVGRYLPVPPAQTVVAPVRPPDWIGHDRIRPPAARRGKAQPFPLSAPEPPARSRSRTVAQASTRRARFFTVVTVPPVTAPPPPPDRVGHVRPTIRTTRRGTFLAVPATDAQRPIALRTQARPPILIRRGRFLAVPPAPIVLPPPPDRLGRSRTKPPATRRGRFTPVPLTRVGAQPWIPPLLSARRPSPRPTRRGRFASCPPPYERPLAHLRRRPSPPPAPRRIHRADPPWTTSRPPDRITGRRCSIPSVPRRRGATPPRPSIAPPPGIAPRRPTRTRPTGHRRGCFWRWSIFQAIHQPVPLPDHLSAIEALTGDPASVETRLTPVSAAEAATLVGATETAIGVLDSREHLPGHTATETPTGRITASETPLNDTSA